MRKSCFISALVASAACSLAFAGAASAQIDKATAAATAAGVAASAVGGPIAGIAVKVVAGAAIKADGDKPAELGPLDPPSPEAATPAATPAPMAVKTVAAGPDHTITAIKPADAAPDAPPAQAVLDAPAATLGGQSAPAS